jgi:hypothetical protein
MDARFTMMYQEQKGRFNHSASGAIIGCRACPRSPTALFQFSASAPSQALSLLKLVGKKIFKQSIHPSIPIHPSHHIASSSHGISPVLWPQGVFSIPISTQSPIRKLPNQVIPTLFQHVQHSTHSTFLYFSFFFFHL